MRLAVTSRRVYRYFVAQEKRHPNDRVPFLLKRRRPKTPREVGASSLPCHSQRLVFVLVALP